ncbi:MAG: hypothetical protein HY050_02245 [Actinobacteria bacterium]|nr:hypothetical protein [Actinomycetota bacterium]
MRKRISVLLVGAAMVASIGVSSAATKLLIPVTKNPIVNKSSVPGLSITMATVENNVDPVTKKDLTDFLLLTVANKSSKAASGVEIFYTMKDSVSKASESYYQKLSNFTIKAGGVGILYFDNGAGVGHFPENKFSLYRSSQNEVKFSILLSAKGLKIAKAVAIKSKGTGEKAGA